MSASEERPVNANHGVEDSATSVLAESSDSFNSQANQAYLVAHFSMKA